MSSILQNRTFDESLINDPYILENYEKFVATFNIEDFFNVQSNIRDEYIPAICKCLFKDELPGESNSILAKLFLKYLRCENKVYCREQINEKLYGMLRKIFKDDINNFFMVLRKLQHIIKYADYTHPQFKIDLYRIERFLMNLILSKYTRNLVRGHRRFKLQ